MADQGFDQDEFARTMERIAQENSFGDTPMRPDFDASQHKEVIAASTAGRQIDAYRRALESASFKFWPAGTVPPGCQGNGPLDPPRPLAEAQWRRMPSPAIPGGLALTENQILAWFPGGPQELWKWIENLQNVNRGPSRH